MKLFSFSKQGYRIWLITLSIAFCLSVIAVLLDSPRLIARYSETEGAQTLYRTQVTIDKIDFDALVADTPDSRTRGLSGTQPLTSREAMLFVFDNSAQHGIWMKEMNYPIDILWINESYRIVDIKKNAQPDSYPEIFQSTKPARYVLELPAGTIETYAFNGLSEVVIETAKK